MSENLKVGGEVIRVKATDKDIGENAVLSYTLPNANNSFFFTTVNIDNEGSIQVYKVRGRRSYFSITI
jgi:hypothetical protein